MLACKIRLFQCFLKRVIFTIINLSPLITVKRNKIVILLSIAASGYVEFDISHLVRNKQDNFLPLNSIPITHVTLVG